MKYALPQRLMLVFITASGRQFIVNSFSYFSAKDRWGKQRRPFSPIEMAVLGCCGTNVKRPTMNIIQVVSGRLALEHAAESNIH